jgi:hypothetical protein
MGESLGNSMTKEKLEAVNSQYEANEEEWRLFYAAYRGIKQLIRAGALSKHERESDDNYNRRIKKAYGFSYSSSVIDLLNFYLFKKPSRFHLGSLADDENWVKFSEDCDFYGNSLNDYLVEEQKSASIYGYVGIIVDRPTKEVETKDEEKKKGIYAYLSSYAPTSILDWTEERDEFGRPKLTYLKLKEDNGFYRLWWVNKWEVWSIENDSPKLIKHGINTLGEIPFVWLINTSVNIKYFGLSDIKDICYIDISILNNLSQGEEIIDYCAFPMLRQPKEEGSGGEDDDVGPTAVLEFDKEFPESKPDWLESESKEPIEAILLWIERKVEEIYRVANTGGVNATERSTQGVKSGIALQTEFALLNSKLVRKGLNVSKAKLSIIKLWAKWEKIEKKAEEVTYDLVTSYDVEQLASDLENALVAKTLIGSSTFKSELQKTIARLVLPALTDDLLQIIDKEVDAKPEEENFDDSFNDDAVK